MLNPFLSAYQKCNGSDVATWGVVHVKTVTLFDNHDINLRNDDILTQCREIQNPIRLTSSHAQEDSLKSSFPYDHVPDPDLFLSFY